MNSCPNFKSKDLEKICISILGDDQASKEIFRILSSFCSNVHVGGLCPNADVIFARPYDLERTVIPTMPMVVYGSYQEFKEITVKSLQSLAKQRFELLLIPTDAEEVIQRLRLALCYSHPVSQALKELDYSSILQSAVSVADSSVELHYPVREQR